MQHDLDCRPPRVTALSSFISTFCSIPLLAYTIFNIFRLFLSSLLLECEKWTAHRTGLRTEAGSRWGDLSYMLGGYTERRDWRTGKQIDGEKPEWKPNIQMFRATVSFLQHTGGMKGSSYEEVGLTQERDWKRKRGRKEEKRKKRKKKKEETQTTKQNKRDSSSSVAPSTLLG